LKEIGEMLKDSREESGVSIEEAAEDLNYKVSQLEAIESGDFKLFKDIFLLKCMITDYSKYLGLNSEEIIDEFNEYVFESTSKIPLDDIEKASKLKDKEEKIASPYTVVEEKKSKLPLILVIVLVVLIIIFTIVFINNNNKSTNSSDKIQVSYEV
jgi:cytoskeletal protein RodZ